MNRKRDLRVHDRRCLRANRAAFAGAQFIRKALRRRPLCAGRNPVDSEERDPLEGHPKASAQLQYLLAAAAGLGGEPRFRMAGLCAAIANAEKWSAFSHGWETGESCWFATSSLFNHIDLGFVWDAWNRLVSLKSDGVAQATYSYDALFRRVKNTQSSGVRTYFYNNLWRSIEERIGGTVERQYVWNPLDRWNLIRRQLISGGSPTQTRFVLRDYLDPVAVVTDSGVVDGRMGFNTFGIGRMMSASYATPPVSMTGWNFSYHGEFRDLESGLYNYGYRYYHPGLGRWISRDPIGEEGGLNLYGFVENSPLMHHDRLGLEKKENALSQST